MRVEGSHDTLSKRSGSRTIKVRSCICRSRSRVSLGSRSPQIDAPDQALEMVPALEFLGRSCVIGQRVERNIGGIALNATTSVRIIVHLAAAAGVALLAVLADYLPGSLPGWGTAQIACLAAG